MNSSNIQIVIAAYNEGEVIADTVRKVLSNFEIVVVVDDCSLDETAGNALAAGAHVLRHPLNLGQGAALQTGIEYALKNGAEYIVTFDADGQHDPEEIMPMLSALQASGAEIAMGSRFLGKTVNMSLQRRLLLLCALAFTRITVRIKITDVHNGFRILTRGFCKSFEFRQNRMAHASEILSHISKHNVNYIECPVTIAYTEYSLLKGQRSVNALRILLELFVGKLSK